MHENIPNPNVFIAIFLFIFFLAKKVHLGLPDTGKSEVWITSIKLGSVFVRLYFDQTRALGCLTDQEPNLIDEYDTIKLTF